jgi:hypothetical protein
MIRKRKKKLPIIESYEMEADDWEADYYFGLAPKNIIEGVYWEVSNLIIIGRLISPVLNMVGKVRVKIKADPEVDDHWKPNPTITAAKAIGRMAILRDNTMEFYCSVPSYSLPYLAQAVHTKKIRYISITGTKLRYKEGTISHISLSSQKEDE